MATSKIFPSSQLKKTTIVFDTTAPSGEQRRPDHTDFMTTAELKKIEFTGMRQNNMALQWEFWILGEMRKSVSFATVASDKFALTKAHRELFHMKPIKGIVD